MIESDKVQAVLSMQDYITERIENEINIDDICAVSGYSKRHSLRIFKELLHKTVFEYIRDCRLTRAAKKLIDAENNDSVLEIALSAGYDTHEGFTKAFKEFFGVLPYKFSKRDFPENYTKPTPMSYYYLLLRSKGMNDMSERTVTATYITKPARKLIVKSGILATDYFSYCDEIGCDIWDILEQVPNRLDNVSLAILPDFLVPKGTSKVCCAAEVPLDYDGVIPEGCNVIELCEHTLLWFNGAPYEDENWYGGAHSEVANAVADYKPELYGFRFAYDKAPEFHYSSSAKDGCRRLLPVISMNR